MAHFGKRQIALVNELGWNKQKASYLWNGKQPFNRDILNEVAAWLDIQSYELLMPPDEAMRLRQLRKAMLAIAAQPSPIEELKK